MEKKNHPILTSESHHFFYKAYSAALKTSLWVSVHTLHKYPHNQAELYESCKGCGCFNTAKRSAEFALFPLLSISFESFVQYLPLFLEALLYSLAPYCYNILL